jgi:hypothetical protein
MRPYFGTDAIVTNLHFEIRTDRILPREGSRGLDPQFIRISWFLVGVDDGFN